MKKPLFILTVALCMAASVANGAVNIKKAAPVATKKADGMESATSLVPTVIGLVSSVKALNEQQQQLSKDCAPTSSEIATVNDLVKEWAKIGVINAQNAVSGLGGECPGDYKSYMSIADNKETCYEAFNSSSDEGMIWQGFPKASSAEKCDANNKNCQTVSNIYDVFAKIPFDNEDYFDQEISKVAKLKEKAERCAPAKIQAAKRELYGGFVTQTLSGIGTSTGTSGTASALQAVTSLGGSGNIQSLLPSLGQIAQQSFDK